MRGRDEHLAAEVPAFLFGGELIFEVHAGRAGFDHRFHQLEGVEWAAETGFRVGDDRREPVARATLALGVFDLVGAQQRLVDAPNDRGTLLAG